jgi:putative redox protein
MEKVRAKATWNGGMQSVLDDQRGHTILVDQPNEEGGENAGPTPLELNVLSLAGCITTIFAIVARKRKLNFSSMSVEIEAERPKGSPTMTRVDGTFHVSSSAAREDIETALRLTVRTCPVGALYEKAGIPIDIKLALNDQN